MRAEFMLWYFVSFCIHKLMNTTCVSCFVFRVLKFDLKGLCVTNA